MQFALGGRGDPDQHEDFEGLLSISRENEIVPNFTTSGFGMTDDIARLCKRYCGAVAVSWYRSGYTCSAIEVLLSAGVKTNVHYVLGNNSIDEAIRRLREDDFPKSINSVVFLLHKPAGLGSEKNVLRVGDSRVAEFFAEFDKEHPFKVGLDSCTVPGVINFCKSVAPESLDTCEGGRFSCYIGPDLVMVPCSFDQERRYEVQLRPTTIAKAWWSAAFKRFRDRMRGACLGCPLMPEVVLCADGRRAVVCGGGV